MTKQGLIFGSTNPGKVLQIQGALKSLDLTVKGVERPINVVEDGATAQENARKKAIAYAEALHEKVLSMDNALYLDGLSDEEQPGIHVRRIPSANARPSDTELLAHYAQIINSYGGRMTGRWEFAVALADSNGVIGEIVIVSPRIFATPPSSHVVEGYPLESLQIDPKSGHYISEMSQAEQDSFWELMIGQPLCKFVRASL